jgi:hypothetical protein
MCKFKMYAVIITINQCLDRTANGPDNLIRANKMYINFDFTYNKIFANRG